MAKNTSFAIGDHFEGFIAQKVASGRYGSASDVMRAALRMMEHEDRKLEALRAAIDEGENSGDLLDGDAVFDELLADLPSDSRA